jgi:hypothetical protein
MTVWTEDTKAELVARYSEELGKLDTDEQRAQESVEIVKQLAVEFEKTTNGVRMILSKAGVYVKKGVTASATTKSAASGTKRVSKADLQAGLSEAISALGEDLVNPDIISKLTGVAAAFFTDVR